MQNCLVSEVLLEFVTLFPFVTLKKGEEALRGRGMG